MDRNILASEILTVAVLIAGDREDIVSRYPVRDHRWHPGGEGNFTTEISDLNGKFTDPWHRPIPRGNVKPIYDREDEIVQWDCWTTVAGVRINLVIFND